MFPEFDFLANALSNFKYCLHAHNDTYLSASYKNLCDYAELYLKKCTRIDIREFIGSDYINNIKINRCTDIFYVKIIEITKNIYKIIYKIKIVGENAIENYGFYTLYTDTLNVKYYKNKRHFFFLIVLYQNNNVEMLLKTQQILIAPLSNE
jgi:hypothetical protein